MHSLIFVLIFTEQPPRDASRSVLALRCSPAGILLQCKQRARGPLGGTRKIAESGRPGRAELLAKKGRIVGGVGCPSKCRTSGKRRGSSGSYHPLELFGKMLHFGKIPKKIGQNLAKIQQTSGKICEILEQKEQKIQEFLTKFLRLESGAYRWAGVCRMYQACAFLQNSRHGCRVLLDWPFLVSLSTW